MLPAEFPVPLAVSPGLALVLLAVSLELPAVSLVPLAESLGLALVLLAMSVPREDAKTVLIWGFVSDRNFRFQGVSAMNCAEAFTLRQMP